MLTSIKSCIDSLPQDEAIEIAIITYDTQLTFYQVASSGEISLMHVGEVEDPFIPLPLSRLMMDVLEDRELIDTVIDKIYNMYTVGAQGLQKS